MDWEAIEEEILSFPGNKPVLEEICELLEGKEAIALVGAGASAGLWPLWNEFLHGLIGHCLRCGRIRQEEADFFETAAPQTPLETAQQLRNKIDENHYFEYLQDTFCDKSSPHTDGAFTPAHHALMQLPISNYMTLNYDAGLTNARAALYPRATTSYYFWDQEEVRRIRDRGFKRLVLHAHGRYDRADSIILTLDDYRKAYSHRPFVRLLEDLFAFERLIIVGFGMGDPYIKQLFANISGDYKKGGLRHIALVGLEEKEMQVTALLRERVEMVYGAQILFYPTMNHHKALTSWLTALAERYSSTPGSRIAEEIWPLTIPPGMTKVHPDTYIHQPTDDENFKGRKQDFALLNRWGNDPAIRIIAVTGIGGQGKTALVGRWLKQERSPELSPLPVFYWSFYEDMDVSKFLKRVIEFIPFIIRIYDKKGIEPISSLLSVVREVRLLLVLDGLEVLQEDTSSSSRGQINHPLLQQLLQQWVRYPHEGLMVLTSRFHFPQLARYSGVSFHHLNLLRLSRKDGASLLEKLGIHGEEGLLEAYVERLYGHPLALRILASTVKRGYYGDLSQFKGDRILLADPEERLSQKLEHLLQFYEDQLKDGQRELLGIISLFKRPVEVKSLVTLLGKMKSLKKTPLAKADEAVIREQLDILIDDFLVEKTREGITTHPVIRDHFRMRHKLAGSRREVADFLKEQPGAERPQNIEEVRNLVEAVQLLCEEGDFKAAHDLVRSRLTKGGYSFNVFRDLPALSEGLECSLVFVKDEESRKKLEAALGKDQVAAHCSIVGLYNYLLGNLSQALVWWHKELNIRWNLHDKHNQAMSLYNISVVEMAMGDIQKAMETVKEPLELSYETRDLLDLHTEFGYKALDLRTEFGYKAYYEFLLGNTSQAYKDFKTALFHWQKRKADEQYLYSLLVNRQAEFLIRIKTWDQFKAVNGLNIKTCETYHWNNTLVFCRLLRGWYEVCRGRFDQAEEALNKAEHILRPSGMLENICRLEWVWGLLAEAKGDYQKGLEKMDESLFTCADRGFRLWQADSHCLRGRLRLQKFRREGRKDKDLLEKAGDDGAAALKITRDTGYIWAKIEALELLSSYHQEKTAIPDYHERMSLRDHQGGMTLLDLHPEKKNDLARQYAKEAESLKAGLFLSEEQMQALNAKARKEFNKHVAKWDLWE